MALYAIGDTHLSLSSDKPMDIFGARWENHTQKLAEGFAALNDDDVCVLCGDLSWGMSLEECLEDFRFLNSLPGRKIIIKGNHDYWWSTATKINKFFADNSLNKLQLLSNNSFEYGEYSICGTRGWFFEEETGGEHDAKIMNREIGRLKLSLDSAKNEKRLVFLHYPPIYGTYECTGILQLLKEYNVRLCCCGHIHGKGIMHAFNGWRNGTEFKLVSADSVNFSPVMLIK